MLTAEEVGAKVDVATSFFFENVVLNNADVRDSIGFLFSRPEFQKQLIETRQVSRAFFSANDVEYNSKVSLLGLLDSGGPIAKNLSVSVRHGKRECVSIDGVLRALSVDGRSAVKLNRKIQELARDCKILYSEEEKASISVRKVKILSTTKISMTEHYTDRISARSPGFGSTFLDYLTNLITSDDPTLTVSEAPGLQLPSLIWKGSRVKFTDVVSNIGSHTLSGFTVLFSIDIAEDGSARTVKLITGYNDGGEFNREFGSWFSTNVHPWLGISIPPIVEGGREVFEEGSCRVRLAGFDESDILALTRSFLLSSDSDRVSYESAHRLRVSISILVLCHLLVMSSDLDFTRLLSTITNLTGVGSVSSQLRELVSSYGLSLLRNFDYVPIGQSIRHPLNRNIGVFSDSEISLVKRRLFSDLPIDDDTLHMFINKSYMLVKCGLTTTTAWRDKRTPYAISPAANTPQSSLYKAVLGPTSGNVLKWTTSKAQLLQLSRFLDVVDFRSSLKSMMNGDAPLKLVDPDFTNVISKYKFPQVELNCSLTRTSLGTRREVHHSRDLSGMPKEYAPTTVIRNLISGIFMEFLQRCRDGSDLFLSSYDPVVHGCYMMTSGHLVYYFIPDVPSFMKGEPNINVFCTTLQMSSFFSSANAVRYASVSSWLWNEIGSISSSVPIGGDVFKF